MEKQLEEKWKEYSIRLLEPVGNALIDILATKGNELVLDVAAGTGGPGISIAPEHAGRKGLENVETCVWDLSTLPFDDNTFDAISCSFGLMFFPDVLHATKEMHRVLKPTGKIAVSVWNLAEKNPWIATILDVIYMNRRLPDPASGAPEIFRCAEDGYLTNLFIQSGFKNIQIGTVEGELLLPSAETYWEMMIKAVPSVAALLADAHPPQIAKIKYELYDLLDRKFRNSTIYLPSSAIVLLAHKNS